MPGPPAFQRVTLKSWEGHGDKATPGPCCKNNSSLHSEWLHLKVPFPYTSLSLSLCSTFSFAHVWAYRSITTTCSFSISHLTQHIHIFQKLVIISLSSQLENQLPLSSSAELTTHQIPVVYSSEKNHPCLDRAQTTRKYKLKRGEHTSTDGAYNLDTYVHTHTPSKRHFCPPNTAAVCVCLRAEGTPNKAGKWTQQLSKSTPGLSLNRLEV